MVLRCCICKSTKCSHPDRTFHMFPIDGDRRAIWLSNLGEGEKELSKFSRICSAHFKLEDFIIKPSGKKFLRISAIPCPPYAENVPAIEVDPDSMSSTGPLSNENVSEQQSVLIIKVNNTKAESGLDCDKSDSSATETAPFSPSDTLTASEFELYSPPPFSSCESMGSSPENNDDTSIIYPPENIIVKEEIEEIDDKDNEERTSQMLNNRKEYDDIVDKENKEIPSQIFNKSRLKVIRYFGDIEIDDLEYPETRETCFNIITKTVNKQKQKIKNLEAKNRRLVNKMYSMKSLTDHVIQRNANYENVHIPMNITRASSEESEADINLWGYEDLKGCAEQINDNMARLQEKLDEVVHLMKQKFPKRLIPKQTVKPTFNRKRRRREDEFDDGATTTPPCCSDSQDNTSWDESDEDFSDDDFESCKMEKCDETIEAAKSIVGPKFRTVFRITRKTNNMQGFQFHPS